MEDSGSPQLKNGYTKIANELLEAFCKTGLPKNAGQIWWYILRKTYGWRHKNSWITFEQIRKGTGILKTHVSREIRRLSKANMIVTQMGNKGTVSYGIQKYYKKWEGLPKRVTITQMGSEKTQMGSEKTQMGSGKPRKGRLILKQPMPKETIIKETIKDYIPSGILSSSNELDADIPVDNFPKKLPKTALYKEIIAFLNSAAHCDFKYSTKNTQALIQARTNEGFSLEDFKRVILHKSQQWLGDPKMVGYLRPQTLFGTKFEGYLNETHQVGSRGIRHVDEKTGEIWEE